MNIGESIKILFSSNEHRDIVNKFVKAAYNERFKNNEYVIGAYHYYDNFIILSETTIRVVYKYGAGDMDFENYFDIEIK